MENKFNYYYSNEAEQFNFYRIPKVLFTDKHFSKYVLRKVYER